TRLQLAIHPNVTATVQFNAGFLKSDSSGVRNTSNRYQDVVAVDVLLTGGGAYDKGNLISRSPTYLEQLGLHEYLNAFVAEYAPHLLRDVHILPPQELSTGLDDGPIAPKATVTLCHFNTEISPADHDQVLWQIIELQSLDMREGLGRLQTGNIRNCRVRSDI